MSSIRHKVTVVLGSIIFATLMYARILMRRQMTLYEV